MRIHLPIFVLLVLGLMVVQREWSDDWPAPVTREVFSPSRDFFVRVVPGKSIGDTVGFRSAPKGPHVTAEFYRREQDRSYRLTATVTLLNPVAPAEFFVTDKGFLITLDKLA